MINKNLHIGNDCKKFYLRFKKVNKIKIKEFNVTNKLLVALNEVSKYIKYKFIIRCSFISLFVGNHLMASIS